MITIKRKKIVVENTNENVLYYPNLFSGPIVSEVSSRLDQKSIDSLSIGLAMITYKIYKPRTIENQPGSMACIVLAEDTATFTQGTEHIKVQCQPGSVFILGAFFRQEWEYKLPLLSIKLYEDNYLPGIYLSTKQRVDYSNKVRKTLSNIHKYSTWKQCIQKNMDLELLGTGSYGNVFKSGYSSQEFAVKLSKLKPESIGHPYDPSFSSWHEVYFLKEILKPLIEKNICPNIPLIFDSFTCDDCELIIDDDKLNTPCVATIVEIANGDLKHYLKEKRSMNELYSALFQIMAALYTIQYYAQIMNFDVKKENILYYNVEPGGYWNYKIRGKDYYIPNFGKLFILNDFGISRSMSPKYPIYKTNEVKTYRLGSRYAMVKDGKFLPFDSLSQINEDGNREKPIQIEWTDKTISTGAEFRMDRKTTRVLENSIYLTTEMTEYLKKQNISTNFSSYSFFLFPDIIPPFEFYNDTQDVIRMFIGGKRTTQKGNHRMPSSIPRKLVKELEPYLGPGESAKDMIFSKDPAQVSAGYFIESFFTNFLEEPKDVKIIARYKISI